MAQGYYGDSYGGVQAAALGDEHFKAQQAMAAREMLNRGIMAFASAMQARDAAAARAKQDTAKNDLEQQQIDIYRNQVASKAKEAPAFEVQNQLKRALTAADQGLWDSASQVIAENPNIPQSDAESIAKHSLAIRPTIEQEHEIASRTAESLNQRRALASYINQLGAVQEANKHYILGKGDKDAYEQAVKDQATAKEQLQALPPPPTDRRLLNYVVQDPGTGLHQPVTMEPPWLAKNRTPASKAQDNFDRSIQWIPTRGGDAMMPLPGSRVPLAPGAVPPPVAPPGPTMQTATLSGSRSIPGNAAYTPALTPQAFNLLSRPPAVAPAPAITSAVVRMQGKDGKIYGIPSNNVPAALARGAVILQ